MNERNKATFRQKMLQLEALDKAKATVKKLIIPVFVVSPLLVLSSGLLANLFVNGLEDQPTNVAIPQLINSLKLVVDPVKAYRISPGLLVCYSLTYTFILLSTVHLLFAMDQVLWIGFREPRSIIED